MISFNKIIFMLLLIVIISGCSASEVKKYYTLSFKMNGNLYRFTTSSQEIEGFYQEIRGRWSPELNDSVNNPFNTALITIPFSATNHQQFHQNTAHYYVYFNIYVPSAAFTLTLDDFSFNTNTYKGNVSGSFSGDLHEYTNVSNVITVSEGYFIEGY